MPRSAAAKLAMKMLAAVRSLGNRQITTMVSPFPIRDKNPVIKEKTSEWNWHFRMNLQQWKKQIEFNELTPSNVLVAKIFFSTDLLTVTLYFSKQHYSWISING